MAKALTTPPGARRATPLGGAVPTNTLLACGLSAKGAGTTFKVWAPVTENSRAAHAATHANGLTNLLGYRRTLREYIFV